MKKFVLYIFIILSIFVPVECLAKSSTVVDNEYESKNTISFYDYLYIKKSNRDIEKLKLNSRGDVVYKNKVILTTKGVPLNENIAYTTQEMKILFKAQKTAPKKNCNPDDINNGSMGCYIDNPDKE